MIFPSFFSVSLSVSFRFLLNLCFLQPRAWLSARVPSEGLGGLEVASGTGCPGLTSVWLWGTAGACPQLRLCSAQPTAAQSASGRRGSQPAGQAAGGMCAGRRPGELAFPRLGLRCGWGGKGSSVSLRAFWVVHLLRPLIAGSPFLTPLLVPPTTCSWLSGSLGPDSSPGSPRQERLRGATASALRSWYPPQPASQLHKSCGQSCGLYIFILWGPVWERKP